MPLETGTYISSLNASNPLGTGDPKSQGDDHLRLIKSTIKNTFPNITGAVTATHTALNLAASVIGTDAGAAGMVADIAALTDPNADRILGWDDSAGAAIGFTLSTGLTTSTNNLLIDTSVVPRLGVSNTFTNAVQIVSATLAEWRATDGAVVTSVRSYLGGTVGLIGTTSNHGLEIRTNDVARIAITNAGVITLNGVAVTDYARLSQANTFTGTNNVFENSGNALLFMRNTSGGTNEKLWAGFTATTTQLGIGSTYTDGGSGVANAILIARSGTTIASIALAATALSMSGTLSTPNTSASEVGYKGAPSRSISASTNTAATDAGGTIRMTGGSGQTFTLDSDPPSDSLVVLRNTSGNNWTIAASGTLTYAAATGSRTLPTGCMAVAQHDGSGNWNIVGTLS